MESLLEYINRQHTPEYKVIKDYQKIDQGELLDELETHGYKELSQDEAEKIGLYERGRNTTGEKYFVWDERGSTDDIVKWQVFTPSGEIYVFHFNISKGGGKLIDVYYCDGSWFRLEKLKPSELNDSDIDSDLFN